MDSILWRNARVLDLARGVIVQSFPSIVYGSGWWEARGMGKGRRQKRFFVIAEEWRWGLGECGSGKCVVCGGDMGPFHFGSAGCPGEAFGF